MPFPAFLVSLPPEVLVSIMLYCNFKDCKNMALAAPALNRAYKIAPILSGKAILRQVYHGNLDCILRSLVTDAYDVVHEVQSALKSQCFQENRQRNHDESLGKDLILIAIYLVVNLMVDTPYNPQFYKLASSVGYVLKRRHKVCHIIQHCFLELLEMATPNDDDVARLDIALFHKNMPVAYQIVERIYNNLDYYKDPYKTNQQVKEIFMRHREFSFFVPSNLVSTTSSHFLSLCANHYRNSMQPYFDIILLDAFMSGELDLKFWFHQLICWMFLARSSSVVRKLLAHPNVDPGRWNNLPLQFTLQDNNPLSVSALTLIQDARVNPSSFVKEIISISTFDWQRKGANVMMQAILTNPNFSCDYYHEGVFEILIREKRPDLFKILCQDPRANVGADNNRLVYLAMHRGSIEILSILLSDERVNPCSQNHCLFLTDFAKNVLEHQWWPDS